MPMVAWQVLSKLSYINLKRKLMTTEQQILVLKTPIHVKKIIYQKPCDKAGLANTLLSQEDQFELPEQFNIIFRKYNLKMKMKIPQFEWNIFQSVLPISFSIVWKADLRGFPKSPEVDILRPVSAEGSARRKIIQVQTPPNIFNIQTFSQIAHCFLDMKGHICRLTLT